MADNSPCFFGKLGGVVGRIVIINIDNGIRKFSLEIGDNF